MRATHRARSLATGAYRPNLDPVMTEPLLRAVELTKIVTSGRGPRSPSSTTSVSPSTRGRGGRRRASGSGKTTLLGLLAGLDLPTRGDVWLDGIALSTLDEDARAALRQRLLGFVFQSFQLLPHLTALENVMLPLELAGAGDAASSAKDWLGRVGSRSARLTTRSSFRVRAAACCHRSRVRRRAQAPDG
jgi:putative ABC transport system ATP-binding protein